MNARKLIFCKLCCVTTNHCSLEIHVLPKFSSFTIYFNCNLLIITNSFSIIYYDCDDWLLTSKVAPLAEDSSLGSIDAVSSSMLPRDAELRSQRIRLPWLLAEDMCVESSGKPWLSSNSSLSFNSKSAERCKDIHCFNGIWDKIRTRVEQNFSAPLDNMCQQCAASPVKQAKS